MHSNEKIGRGSELLASLSLATKLVERWHDLADCHTAEFISANLWEKVVPDELRLELEAADPKLVLSVFCEQAKDHNDHHNVGTVLCMKSPLSTETSKLCHDSPDNSSYVCPSHEDVLPNFKHFLLEARNACKTFFTLTTSPEDLFNTLSNYCVEEKSGQHSVSHHIDLEEPVLPLMSDKKQHEVRAMAAVVSRLADTLGSSTAVVDLGAGKGYLGAAVARVNRPVLGLEIDEKNAKAAADRVARLHASKEGDESGSEWLRTATVSVSANTDIASLVSTHFALPDAQLTLAGLHMCGDLTANALHIFLRTPSARAACLVSCCYHLLSDTTTKFPDFHSGSPNCQFSAGFPLSQRLHGCVLGRNARMLAQQSLERSLADMQQVMISVRGLHWRALLEILLPSVRSSPAYRVGRLAAQCKSFPEYACRAFRKLGICEQSTFEELNALAIEHKPNLYRLQALALLRLALAPVLEQLVLLDRAQLLQEHGISRWFLVQLFAPIVSPRCFALIALKEPGTK